MKYMVAFLLGIIFDHYYPGIANSMLRSLGHFLQATADHKVK